VEASERIALVTCRFKSPVFCSTPAAFLRVGVLGQVASHCWADTVLVRTRHCHTLLQSVTDIHSACLPEDSSRTMHICTL
jgi:hypothetical protein